MTETMWLVAVVAVPRKPLKSLCRAAWCRGVAVSRKSLKLLTRKCRGVLPRTPYSGRRPWEGRARQSQMPARSTPLMGVSQ